MVPARSKSGYRQLIDWRATDEGLLQENSTGCLVGLAAGDALSAPTRSLDAAEISARYGVLSDMLGGGPDVAPGDTTGDSVQALALAESIIDRRGFDPSDFAQRLVRRLGGNRAGVDAQTRAVLEQISAGKDWEKAALETQMLDPAGAGNSPIMRCAPIALYYHASPPLIIENSRLSSRVTHPHSHCQWACAFVNLVISELLVGSTAAKAVDNALAHCAHRGDINREMLERVRKASFRAGGDKPRPSGFILDTLECAIWSLLHTDSFDANIIEAVNLGGDPDPIGAVAGALAGAAYGLSAIPDKWLALLQERERLRQAALELVA